MIVKNSNESFGAVTAERQIFFACFIKDSSMYVMKPTWHDTKTTGIFGHIRKQINLAKIDKNVIHLPECGYKILNLLHSQPYAIKFLFD